MMAVLPYRELWEIGVLWEWRLATKNLPQDNGQLHDHSRRGRRSHTHSLFWWGAILPGGVVGGVVGVASSPRL